MILDLDAIDKDHPLQYAFVGRVFVADTGDKIDDEVRREAGVTGLPVERFQRCPTCEQWSPCDVRIEATPLWRPVDYWRPRPGATK